MDDIKDSQSEDITQTELCCPSKLSCCLATFFPLCWCSCVTVNEREESVILAWGKYVSTIRSPGCYCYNCFGIDQRKISTARTSINLANVKVADQRGNPLLLSGVVTYELRDARKAALEVKDVGHYIQIQGLTVMKRIASMYPYESRNNEHSLKSEAKKISEEMVQLLQERCAAAGVHVIGFELTDLAYAPEIAQAMLIRQQAEVMLDARRIIVEGAVGICNDAMTLLQQKGVKMSVAEQSRLVANLLVTVCGESGVKPVINVGGGQDPNSQVYPNI